MDKKPELSVAVSSQETLLAKELIRQRTLPDGSVENLVKWCIFSPPKNPTISDDKSSSTSLNGENRPSKYVFLWMSNQELMVCCPQLYNAEPDKGLAKQTNKRAEADPSDPPSDVEDLDDMRHDVVKLVNRARKQMQRLKNMSKSLPSLTHTIKVLRTYASLGSLSNVFRETGALDLILELLWTKDEETRRAAGRMLRALALNDAGSRAYVLLSLTQNESEGQEQKKHYADFENRVMVMEMFAETASGEEAHAVALDSVQLPQVTGKTLFTLMKCYLRVTSLMDIDSSSNTHQGKTHCSWMALTEDSMFDETVHRFEVSMAISDLIYELGRIMDWNKSSKAGSALPATSNLATSSNAVSSKNSPTVQQQIKEKKTDNNDMEVPVVCKPLFAERLQETTLDPALLASLIKSDHPLSEYKHPSAFDSRRHYANYVKSIVKAGYRVRACQSYQDVTEGDEGVYRQHNESTPPVQVFWHRLNRAYWVYWHHIVLVRPSDVDADKPIAEPLKFIANPDTSLLWPLLSGMSIQPKRIYGLRPPVQEVSSKEKPELDVNWNCSEKDWWLLLFYVSKLSKVAKESIKKLFAENLPSSAHMCSNAPSRDTIVLIVRLILEEATEWDKKSLAKSPMCKSIMDDIIKEQEDAEKKRGDAERPSSPSKQDLAPEDMPGTSSSSQPPPIDESLEQTPPPPAALTSKHFEERVDSRVQEYGSVEEYAKAVEMGLRISLIQDGETEKKYGKLFLDKDNYALGQRLWKMQQEEEKLSTVSKLVEKGNHASRIIALTVLHNLLSRADNPREEIEEMFGEILPTAEDSDASVVLCYLNLVSTSLKEQTGAPRSRELQCLEISLATTGHLKAAFDAIARFPEHRELVSVAIHDICAIMGAREFSANPTANQSYTNIITAIISSIVMTTTGGTEPSTSSPSSATNNVLASFIQAVCQLFTDADKAKKSESSTDSQTKLFCSENILVDAVSVVCMILRKDQSKALVPKRETMLRIVTTGLQIATNPGPLRRLVMRMKGFVMSLSRDVLDDDYTADESSADKYLDFTEDGLTIGRFVVPSSNPDLEENFNDCLNKIKSKEHAEAMEATSKLIVNVVLPILRKQSVLSNECMQCVTQVKNFVSELSGLAQDLNLLLLESYWSKLVAALHHVIEQCALMADGVKATLQEVAGDCISTLLTLADMDKDFAVELCGLEAKQTITRLVDKHGSVAKANDLKQLVTSCERHRSLHNKLLAVVLGGCISTALRCVEEARRNRREINVPLFSQLLDNLCRGADVEMKEHKCWERLEVSTNQRQVAKLTDGNPKTYWESNGSSGGHWIDVFMKKGVVVRKMTILVAQEDSSYMPARVVVLGGSSSQDATTQLSFVTLSSSDRDVVILENAWRYWPVIRISIRRCQQGGIDTRIHGIDIIGPKPSFWPILRRQLYVRTSLAYSVQAHSWVAQALEGATEQLSLSRHRILDLSDKIVEALNFEQRFADSYLPNAESALVLGHACRSALSAPILAALLKSTEDSTCLLADLMQSYVSAVRMQEDSRRERVFASKLRRITRILVDLDTKKQRGGVGFSSGSGRGGKKSDGGTRGTRGGSYSLWDKRLHTRHGEAGNVDSSKVSTAQSVTSFRGCLDINSRNDADHDTSSSQNESGEESYEAPSQIPELCKHWSKVVEREFTEFLSKVLGKSPVPSSGDCLELGAEIVAEFRFLQSCTQDLFGANSYFAMAFAAGVCKSFMVLATDDCVHFSVVCSYVIHRYVGLETARDAIDRGHAEKLRACVGRVIAMLQVAAGADLCRVLEPIYCSMLCSRVLRGGDAVALEKESRFVSQLHACFPGRRPMSMLQDLVHSGNLWQRFLPNWLEAYDVAIRSSTSADADTLWDDYKLLSNGGFQATILRPSAWNLKPVAGEKFQRCLSRLDRRLHRFTRDFGLFFLRERTEGQSCCFSSTGPSLHWTTDGSAVVADAANNVEFRVTTLQMILLLHFNEVAESKFEDWLDCGALNAADQLLQAGVIEKTDEGAFRAASMIPHDVDCCVSPDDKLLALWNARDQMERHDDRRRSIVDCAIVRVMKKRHECTGDLLLHDVMLYCHAPEKSEYAPEEGANHDAFLPSARMVRTRCELLTSLGYLIHSDLKPQMLTYNPDMSVQSDDIDVASGAGNDVTATPPDGADATFSRLESPLKDSILTSESVLVEVDTSVSKSTTSASPSHATSLHTFTGDSGSGRQEVPYLFGFQEAATETLTSAQILAEIRTLFSRVSDLLSVDADTSEALVLQLEWNVDKLIESFVVDQAKTLARIGVAQVKNNACSEESDSSDESSCPVCFNDLTADDTLVPLCGHRCCRSCWQTYLRMQVEQDTSANTTCPVSDCSARAVTSLIKRAFDADIGDMMAKHEISLVRSYVQSDRALSWCHNPKGCSHLLRKSAESHESGLCAECGWQTCFLCAYSEAHFPASCGHMSQWVDDGGYYEGMNDDAQSKHLARLIAKRCPNCLANIEKNDGCLHMKCTKCSWDFCWRCLQPWRPSHRDYYNCSRKVSKLAQSGLKFVEYSKRCQYHNQVKQFAYSIRARALAIDDQSVPPANVRFAADACTKMAQCRKALAYCNVFSYYSEDSERMGAVALHSAALENHTLELQALISDMMLAAADIKCAVAAFLDCDVTKVRRVMADCDAAMERIAVFARQDMKVGSPRKAGEGSAGDESKIFRSRSLSALEREADVSNARPGGMSDDDDDDNGDVRFYSDSDSDNVMSLHTTSDEDDDDDDDGDEGDDDPNMLFGDSDQPTDSSEFGFDSDAGCLF